MNLEDILEGCLRGDKHCQASLYHLFAGKMMGVCLRYARNHQEAEDLLQEGFIKVFKYLRSFENKGSFEGWVRKIMVNTAIKYFSKQSVKNEEPGIEAYQEASQTPEAISNLTEMEIVQLINQLPDGYRIVFNLYVVEGYSHKEISELLEIQESTSRSQLLKARMLLQKRLNGLQKVAL